MVRLLINLRLIQILKELIKELIEVINYSIPHLSKLNSEKNYILLTDLIETNLNKNLVNIVYVFKHTVNTAVASMILLISFMNLLRIPINGLISFVNAWR